MIHKLELNEFTVFKKASLEFGKRINVLIGENGSGKTQILKFLYATLNLLTVYQKNHKSSLAWGSVVEQKDLDVFKSVFNVELVADLVNMDYRNKKTRKIEKQATKEANDVNVIHEDVSAVKSENRIVFQANEQDYNYHVNLCFKDVIAHNLLNDLKSVPEDLMPKGLFLPTHELLTLFPHYLSLLRLYKLPYDSTYDDAITKLGLPRSNQYKNEFASVVDDLEEAIDGTIFQNNGRFYYHPNSAKKGQDIDINLTAEGWRKLGMILHLLKNGQLRRGIVLLWDEPEANLNPKLICLIAKMLIELSKRDVQVFITTHSLFLLREIDMLSKAEKTFEQGDMRYFNFLGKGKVEQGNAPEDLDRILLLDESLKQSDRFLKMED